MSPDVDELRRRWKKAPSEESWDGEATEVPLLQFTVSSRRGLIDLRPVPRTRSAPGPVIHVPPRRDREPKPRSRRARRAGTSRDGPRSSDDDEPHELDAASRAALPRLRRAAGGSGAEGAA
jgi:hypothetical protein